MRVRALLFATAASMILACSGSNPQVSNPGTGNPIGGGTGQLPGGTGDGGTTTDGGTATDGGTSCTLAALPQTVVNTTADTCVTGTATTATIHGQSCDAVTISVFDGLNCFGTLTGAGNAFSGTCNGGLPCSSIHLPGTITCTQVNGQPCTITICDVAGNCPNP